MVDHHIVFDHAKTVAYGPFPSRSAAVEWLNLQGLTDNSDDELSIMPLYSINERVDQ